jgi:hypothetical protein
VTSDARVLPFPGPPAAPADMVTWFPFVVHSGDERGPILARFTDLTDSRALLDALTGALDVTVVDVRTNRIVAVGGPIFGQLDLDLDAGRP